MGKARQLHRHPHSHVPPPLRPSSTKLARSSSSKPNIIPSAFRRTSLPPPPVPEISTSSSTHQHPPRSPCFLFIAMAVSSSASAVCLAVGAYPPLVRGRRMVYRHQHHRHRHRRQRQLQVPPSVLPTSSSRSALRSHVSVSRASTPPSSTSNLHISPSWSSSIRSALFPKMNTHSARVHKNGRAA